MTFVRAIRVAVFLLGAGIALAACHQNGTVFVVGITADTVDANPGDGLCADAVGDCSLRAAVMEANATPGVEEIRLSDGETYTLSLVGFEDAGAAGDLDITEAVVMTGEGTITAATSAIGRILHVSHPSGLVEIDGPDLTGGTSESSGGAAILHDSAGMLSVLRSEIRGHTMTESISGTVVASSGTGTLYLWSSTVHDNTATALGVGVGKSAGVLDLQNATIEGASPMLFGPGDIAAVAIFPGGSATAKHSTILGAWIGPGTVATSVVNECPTIFEVPGTPSSAGHNINPDGSCTFAAASDQVVDPELGPITDNGGGTPTAAPRPGSPVLDTAGGVNCTIFSLDARDEARPNNGVCDTGAVELQVGPDCASPGPAAQMQYCDLAGSLLSFLDLTGADLTGADLSGSGPHLLTNFTNVTFVDADLTNANLSGTVVTGADFSDASVASLRATSLTGIVAAPPTGWSQVGANLIGPFADVIGGDFTGEDLTGLIANDVEAALADFVDADLTNAVFDRADFQDADLRGATTTGASFVDADWDDTWCPDGTLSTSNPGQTCIGHL